MVTSARIHQSLLREGWIINATRVAKKGLRCQKRQNYVYPTELELDPSVLGPFSMNGLWIVQQKAENIKGFGYKVRVYMTIISSLA